MTTDTAPAAVEAETRVSEVEAEAVATMVLPGTVTTITDAVSEADACVGASGMSIVNVMDVVSSLVSW